MLQAGRMHGDTKKGKWSGIKMALVGSFFALVLFLLWVKAFYIQIVLGDKLAKQAKGQYWLKEITHGERGEILDRSGVLLAKSIVVKSVFARPELIVDKVSTARILAKILGRPVKVLQNKLARKRGFVWIARKIDDLKAFGIKQADLDGIYLSEEKKRFYPQARLAGQLLGFVGMDNQGLEGLELSFNDYLAGEKREFLVQKDARGHPLYAPGQLGAHRSGPDVIAGGLRGRDLQLTLDARIQNQAELALKKAVSRYEAKGGQCLVIDVPTGEILAWAIVPFFNPNVYQTSNPRQWKNRIALDVFEPGSTMKPFLVAAAMEEGLVKPRDIVFCENGSWLLSGHRLDDTHKYGWLTVSKVIRYSSNIGAAKIGLRLGAKNFFSYLKLLGIGQRTGLPLPAESVGTLRNYKRWNQVDLATASFGQGVALTTLQLAQAYLCLANKGLMIPLRLVLRPGPKRALTKKRIFSQRTARDVLYMLLDVVALDGTGTRARIPGVQIGGKTGTAQKADSKGGYGKKYVASFVGIFPALNPRYLIVAVVDEPQKNHYGGVVAVPVVKRVSQQILAMYPLLDGQRAAFAKKSAQVLDDLKTEQCQLKEKKSLCLRGRSLRQAVELLARLGIAPEMRGNGVWVQRGKIFTKDGGGRGCTLWLTDHIVN